ncbi:tetratricopeptide repeat protein [Thermophagus xiamenensis]|uniref:Tetratricopeptide repeat-containing protein n=1 Tax=Thermophagus xiamenensis TaxID=385682 RepID=A0A1I1YIS6_9BACT|nr:tetratricopeptide repeat protein [Thermophagus xiamenensis]SFE19457.1 Tetratricopeptide repeat-containing protein [Thermophagus xiamenensis]
MKAFTIIVLGLLLSLSQTFAQKGVEDGSKYGHGEDSIRCLKNLSLYTELVKQKLYDDAYPYWQIAFNECPLSTRRLYTDGVDIMTHKIKNAKDDAEKETYFQKLMEVYDQRMKYFGDHSRYGTPYIKATKAIDILEYKKSDPEYRKQAYQLLADAIANDGAKYQPAAFALYVTTSIALWKDGEISGEDVVNNYTSVSSEINKLIEDPKMAKYKNMYTKLSGQLEDVFAGSGVANCETLDKIYSPQLEEHKEDLDWLKRVNRLLTNALCDDLELLFKVSEYMYNIEPSSSAAFGLARMYLKSGESDNAIKYYEEAIKLEEDNEKKADYYYQLGLVHLAGKNYVSARANALKAIENKANWGKPYILIGKAYAASANSIGSSEFEHKTAYWAAVDKFIKAKSVDPESAEEANELIRTYSNHFPKTDEIFFQGLEEGSSYTVGGWIGERTTVRSSR